MCWRRGMACLFCSLITLGLFFSTAFPASAQRLPVEAFSTLPGYEQAVLSPDLKYLAYLYPIKGRRHLVIQSASGGGNPVIVPPGKDADIFALDWANDERLLVSYELKDHVEGLIVSFTRLIAINHDGSDARSVVRKKSVYSGRARGQFETQIVDFLPDDREHILLALDDDLDGTRDVVKINIYNGNERKLVSRKSGVQYWLADQNGDARLGWGYLDSEFVVKYKNPVSGIWDKVSKTQWHKDGYRAVGFDRDPRFAFATGPISGRTGLVKLDLTNGDVVQKLFTHPRVDLDAVVFDASRRRIVGVRYTDEHSVTKYFDPAYQQIQNRINAAAPSAINQITDPHPKHGVYLVHSSGGQQRSGYYLFNARTDQFYLVAPTGPKISPTQIVHKRPVSYRARDGQLIHGYLTVPKNRSPINLPVVVMPHGGPKSRDDQHYDYWSQFVANRGYAVFQPNFRGSTGYGAAFEKAGEKQWGGLMQDDVTDGAEWLIREGIANANQLCIVGWSYGGYSALMGAVKTPDLYKCAASVNGVTKLPSMVTHDKKFLGGTAWTKDMALDGERRKAVSPYHQIDKIKIPILLVADKEDARVPYQQSKSMYQALKRKGIDTTYIQTDGGGHSLDHQAARQAMLEGLEIFLDKNLGQH